MQLQPVLNLLNAGGPLLGGVFSPTDLVNLEYWFDANEGITLGAGLEVASWADQSENGRDVSQANPGRRPAAANRNGFAAIDYINGATTATNLQITLPSASIPMGAGTLFVVIEDIQSASTQLIVEMTPAFDTYMQLIGAGDRFTKAGAQFIDMTLTPRAVGKKVVIIRYSDGTIPDMINDLGQTETGPLSGNFANTVANGLYIGSFSGLSSPFDGFVFEVGFYSDRISDGNRNRLMDYLKTKWGL